MNTIEASRFNRIRPVVRLTTGTELKEAREMELLRKVAENN
jgi:hypothetical protein